MKNIFVISTLIVSLLMCGVAMADSLSVKETLEKTPAIENGGYYSIIDSRFNYSATIKALGYKDIVALNIGWAGLAKNTRDKAIVTISYNMLKLKDYLDVPILDLIVFNPYISAGYGRINIEETDRAEFDLGIGANILSIKW